MAVAAFLPWTVSGTVARSSFATVRSARLLGIGDHPVITALLGVWFLVPALALTACLGAVLGRERLAGAVSVAVGTVAVTAAVIVARGPLAIGAGVWFALVAGVVALAGGLLALVRG